jgi:predicted kinase
MRAVITVGISASGKTTWANEQCANLTGWRNINRDDMRAEIMRESGLEPVWRNWKWKWEDKVTDRINARLQEYSDAHWNIIVSDTNLDKTRREQLAARLHAMGWMVEFKFFGDVSYDEAVKRDNERYNGVGYNIIQKQWQQYLDDMGNRIVQDAAQAKAAIVDIDGTVALMNGRGPFEWDKVDQDLPNQAIIDMVMGLHLAGYYILFTSGRDGACRELTRKWIKECFPENFDEDMDWRLLMRKPGDQRKDTIVKEEIFREHILGHFNVVVVLDDRPSVCRMWRDLGLNVVQVGNPYIEF